MTSFFTKLDCAISRITIRTIYIVLMRFKWWGISLRGFWHTLQFVIHIVCSQATLTWMKNGKNKERAVPRLFMFYFKRNTTLESDGRLTFSHLSSHLQIKTGNLMSNSKDPCLTTTWLLSLGNSINLVIKNHIYHLHNELHSLSFPNAVSCQIRAGR